MKLSEITKDEFHQRLVDPLKAEFLERFERYQKAIEPDGFTAELIKGEPFWQIVNTWTTPFDKPIQSPTFYLQRTAKEEGHMFERWFAQENEIGWLQSSRDTSSNQVTWNIAFGRKDCNALM